MKVPVIQFREVWRARYSCSSTKVLANLINLFIVHLSLYYCLSFLSLFLFLFLFSLSFFQLFAFLFLLAILTLIWLWRIGAAIKFLYQLFKIHWLLKMLIFSLWFFNIFLFFILFNFLNVMLWFRLEYLLNRICYSEVLKRSFLNRWESSHFRLRIAFWFRFVLFLVGLWFWFLLVLPFEF